MFYMAQYYDRISSCRIRRNTIVYGQINARLLSPYTEIVYSLRFTLYLFVYDRISPYMVTEIYDPNTMPCKTPKYDRIRKNTKVYCHFTSVYELHTLRPGLNASRFVSDLTVFDVDLRLHAFQISSKAQAHHALSMLILFVNVASHV